MATPRSQTEKQRTVFVVHGRDEHVKSAMFDFLRAIDLRPLEWSKAVEMTGAGAPFIGEVLDKAFTYAQAVVVLMSPDDEGRLREHLRRQRDETYEFELTGRARQNVDFEAGMALGRQPKRTILVEFGKLRPFSDLAGRHTIRWEDTVERRNDLANRLKTAGCAVDTSGEGWLSAGNFEQSGQSEPRKGSSIRKSPELSNLGKVQEGPALSIPRVSALAVQSNDEVLVLGGLTGARVQTTSELISVNGVRMGPRLKSGCSHNGVATLPDGRSVVLQKGRICEIYDPSSESLLGCDSAIMDHDSWFSMTILPDGRVLVVSAGQGSSAHVSELLDPEEETFTLLPETVDNRMGHAAVLLSPQPGRVFPNDGAVLITGGSAGKTSELFKPTERQFATGRDLCAARAHHLSVELPSGDVLLVGGRSGSNRVQQAEIYRV